MLAGCAKESPSKSRPPFDPSRLTSRQKDELIRDLVRVVEAQAAM